MKISWTNTLVFSFASYSVVAARSNDQCCLCNDCGTIPENKQKTLIQVDDGTIVQCSDLELMANAFSEDRCFEMQQTHQEVCCYEKSIADPITDLKEHYSSNDIVELIVPDDYEFSIIDEEEEFSPSIARKLWTIVGIPKTEKTSSWTWGWSSWSSSSKSSTTTSTTTTSGTSTSTTTSSSDNSDTQSMCSLCRDESFPKNPSQGVVVSHFTYSFTGACRDLHTDIQKLETTHQMCKVIQAQFDWTCGCNKDYKAKDNNNGWGSWGW